MNKMYVRGLSSNFYVTHTHELVKTLIYAFFFFFEEAELLFSRLLTIRPNEEESGKV